MAPKLGSSLPWRVNCAPFGAPQIATYVDDGTNIECGTAALGAEVAKKWAGVMPARSIESR